MIVLSSEDEAREAMENGEITFQQYLLLCEIILHGIDCLTRFPTWSISRSLTVPLPTRWSKNSRLVSEPGHRSRGLAPGGYEAG